MDELIQSAYRKTRSSIYYDRGNLHTRLAFSDAFDQDGFELQLREKIEKIVAPVRPGKKRINSLNTLLKKLDVVLQPKKLQGPNTPSSETFHTNID